MPRFGLAAGVTASPDLAQQRVLTRRRLAAVASVAIVLTGMVNSLLHEAAHAVAGMAQGLTPTISPFSVSYEPEGTAQQRIIGAAGPLFGLAMGLSLMIVARQVSSEFPLVSCC
jgi:hypothetical protein